jgi:hypothetical protein
MLVETQSRSELASAVPRARDRRPVEAAHESLLKDDLPAWKAIAGMITLLALLVATLISVCFLAAALATGHAF